MLKPFIPRISVSTFDQLWFVKLAIFFSPWSLYSLTGAQAPLQLSAAFCLLAYLVDVPRLLLAGRYQILSQMKSVGILLLFWLWIALSVTQVDTTIIWGGQTGLAAYFRQVLSFVFPTLFYVMIILSVQSWDEVRAALRVYLWGVLPVVFFAGLEVANILSGGFLDNFVMWGRGDYKKSEFLGMGIQRLNLLASEPSFAATYIQTIFALALGWFLYSLPGNRQKRDAKKWIILAGIISLLTFAKTLALTLFGILLGLMIIYSKTRQYFSNGRFRRVLLALSFTMGVVVIVSIAYISLQIGSIFGMTGEAVTDFSIFTRSFNILIGLKMGWAHPLLGVGFGNFAHQYGFYQLDDFQALTSLNSELTESFADRGVAVRLSANNLWVHVFGEMGFLGVGTLMAFFTSGASACLSYMRNHFSTPDAVLVGAVLLAVLSIYGATFQFVHFNLYYIWFLVALLHICGHLAAQKTTIK